MKKYLISLIAFLFLITSAFGQRYITTSAVTLRNNSNTNAKIVQLIPVGAEVYVVQSMSDGWCLVMYNNQVGYLNKYYLTSGSKATSTRSQIKYYTNSAGQRVQSPTYYPSAPAGATARCVDGTYSFSKNRRGTCSHHGGVAQWL